MGRGEAFDRRNLSETKTDASLLVHLGFSCAGVGADSIHPRQIRRGVAKTESLGKGTYGFVGWSGIKRCGFRPRSQSVRASTLKCGLTSCNFTKREGFQSLALERSMCFLTYLVLFRDATEVLLACAVP